MNKIHFLLLFFCLTGLAYARDHKEDSMTEDYWADSLSRGYDKEMYRADSILIKKPVSENQAYPKVFKENLPARYQGEEFNYTTIRPRASFLQKLQQKIMKILESIFGENSFRTSAEITTIFIRLFAIILVGFLLYFIIKYLIGKEGNFFLGKKNKKIMLQEEELHENIHEINFPETIAQFERERAYRSAIRYHFLYILKKMSDQGWIIWNPEKTNKDYVAELKTTPLKNEFSNLAYIFDYVWYGEFSINDEEYLKFKLQYQAFKL